MWIMTPNGFISAVADTNGALVVRARDRDSLASFARLAGIPKKRIVADWAKRRRDYPYRVKNVSPDELKRYLAASVDGIDYTNFKDRAKKVRGHVYAKALFDVWVTMRSLTPRSVTQAMDRADLGQEIDGIYFPPGYFD